MSCNGDTEKSNKLWYLDLGANNHITDNKNIFYNLDETPKGNITFGDKLKVPVMGSGGILIKMKNGDHEFISNVYYVPALKTNILSIGQLVEKDYHIEMNRNGLLIRNGNRRMIARVPMTSNKMFKLKINNDKPKCLKASLSDSSWFWHSTFSHSSKIASAKWRSGA